MAVTFKDPNARLLRRPLRLELGCGYGKRDAAAVGIDMRDMDGVDVVGDAYEVLESLPDASVELIRSEHFLEHVPDLERLLQEAARVLLPGGRFLATTPHFSSPYFYSDSTHRAFFGLYTLAYYVAESPLRRKVPQYGDPLPFELRRPKYSFTSPRPFYGRRAIREGIGWIFNANRWLQEFYEENLCWLFPCYEIRYELRRH